MTNSATAAAAAKVAKPKKANLAAHAKNIRDSMGALALHEAWTQYTKKKDPFK